MVKNVLVVECTTHYNWYKIFDGAKLTNGEEIRIEQASWQEFNCTAYFDSGLIVELQKARRPLPNTPQNTSRTIKPDFILIRSLCQFLNDSINQKSTQYFFYKLIICRLLQKIKHKHISLHFSSKTLSYTFLGKWIVKQMKQTKLRKSSKQFCNV